MSNQLAARRGGLWRDFYEMTKPKVVLLMLITAWVGMALAPSEGFPLAGVLLGTLGIAALAASGAAFNHLLDRKIDQRMARTHRRPVATGRVSLQQGMVFAVSLSVIGFVVLYVWVNSLTAWLTLASMVGYAAIYTGFLKRATPQNIVIGGLAGAMPPLLGWTSITGHIGSLPLLLVLIIFAWTPPHFWALAIHRIKDYQNADIPMMPVTHGIAYTKIHVWLYSWLLLAISLLPFATLKMGPIYAVCALLLGARYLQWNWWLLTDRKPNAAWGSFRFSITYLLLLFVSLLLDHTVRNLL